MSGAERRTAPEEGWQSLTVDELRQELESRGLKKSGTKDELVTRLTEDDETEGASRQLPAASREEAPAEHTAPSVLVSASAKYVRTAPRKARLVMAHIRGKPVEQARAILHHGPRAAADDILKLLDSAVANAESNYELAADELRIQRAFVDEGPTIKRYRPRALGRATRINKRTSHMTIELTTSEEA